MIFTISHHQDDINFRCKKILLAKKWLDLDRSSNVFPRKDSLTEKLNNSNAKLINWEIAKSSLVVLKNEGLIPLDDLSQKKVAYIHIGNDKGNHFFESLNRYLPTKYFSFYENEKEFLSSLKI